MGNPERLESPNPAEKRPKPDPQKVIRALGQTAVKGSQK